jgi:Flp pilus assembly protein TadD
MPSRTLRTSVIGLIRLSAFAVGISCALTAFSQPPADPLAESRAFLAAGNLTRSEASVRAYLNLHPAFADGHFLLGYVLFREQKPLDSLAEFTAGARIRRPKADELKTVASDYVLLGDYADADTWFTAVTAETPLDADAWYLLGRTKFNENSFSDALSSFERALALHAKYIEAENNLGLCWRELNSPGKARAAFQTAIDWQGDAPSDSQPFLNLGTMFADERDFSSAVPLLTKAAQLSPENPKIHEELGHVYEGQGILSKAQSELEQAVALAPNTPALHFELGQIYRREQLRALAEHEFEVCEKLNSTHSSSSTPNPLKSAPDFRR